MEEGTVDRHKPAAKKVEFAQQKYKFPVRPLKRRPVIPAEVGDGPVAGPQPLEQPHQFQIALRLLLEATRGADPIEIAVKIGLQKVRRMVAWLSRPAATTGMPEPKLLKIESADIGLDRPNRIISRDIILNARRQKAQLLPARAGLIRAIRHDENRTSIQIQARKILAQPLFAKPIIGCQIARCQRVDLRPARDKLRDTHHVLALLCQRARTSAATCGNHSKCEDPGCRCAHPGYARSLLAVQ